MDLTSFREYKKIALVGNIASGKTTFARKLSLFLNIPVTHVDAIQFDQNLNIIDLNQTRDFLNQVIKQSCWIIDGHGPLDQLEERFKHSDLIIFIDLPVYKNFLLLTYRLLKNVLLPRTELPQGHSELRWNHIKKQYRTIWAIHKKMRPELIRMLSRKEFKPKWMTLNKIQSKFFI